MRSAGAALTMQVLVYGGGVAASAVAIELADRGHEVALAGPVEPSRWPMILDGGINLGDPDEGVAASLRCGDHRAAPAALRAMWREAPAIEAWLEGALGIPFARDAGHLALRRLPGSPTARARFVEGRTELCIAEALELAALRRRVTVREPFELVELAHADGVVVGAVLCNLTSGSLEAVAADAVVLATGGPEKCLRGDVGAIATERAVAVALRAGAVAVDLNLVQEHPTALWRDGVPTVLSPAWRSEGAILWLPEEPSEVRVPSDVPGRERRRILAEAHPGWAELAPDNLGAHALRGAFDAGSGIYNRKGREVRRRAYLDLTHLPDRLIEGRLSAELRAIVRRFGADASRAPLLVAPASLGNLGGLWVWPGGDHPHATSLPGLFAVGPVAPLYHGACRMGGTGLLADLAGARRAGGGVSAYEPLISKPRAKDALSEAVERAADRARGRADGADPVDAFGQLVGAAREGRLKTIAQLRGRGIRAGGRGPAAVTPDGFADLLLYFEAGVRCQAARAAGARRHAFIRMAPGGPTLVGGFEIGSFRVDSAIEEHGVTPRHYAEGHG